MKTLLTTMAASAFILSTSANAALIERLGGLAYYDDVADLTWLADANYAMTSGYDADGSMAWDQANTWVASLVIDGVTGWRLPETLQPDVSCGGQNGYGYQSGDSYGFDCSGSEMGNLFYNVLGNSSGSLTNTGPFSNVQSLNYWSATEYAHAPYGDEAWMFYFNNGDQTKAIKSFPAYAWAVHSGDVAPVPVPAAAWLFGSGLLSLIGVGRRKKPA